LLVDSGDAGGSLQRLTERLKEMKLLKEYPPRELHEAVEAKVPVPPPPVVRRDGFLEKAGEIASLLFEQMRYVRLFTDDELKELLSDPDPSNFETPVELGMAYDWMGKFSEAKAELEKDQTLQGRFELGRFLVTGRPGMPADRPRGNSLLESVVNELEGRVNTLTASEGLLGARACLSMELEMAKEWQKCQRMSELCANFCEKAIGMGENAGHYYSGWIFWRLPRPRGVRQDIERFWKAFPSDDPEACMQAILYCGTDGKYMDRRDIVPHLKMLKNAICARNNRAQYVLGMLYLHGWPSMDHAYLVRDVERARFWITRAAERGDREAKARLAFIPQR
ncbi:MAG: SEL1-like repeat protein, partial [Victivallales bacterium]|nr:SEL1-like repeat protein [Victivallales bacterium]